MFRFTLDGNVLSDEPEGWSDIVSELRRDKEIRGQLLLMELTLIFKGGTDGYNILKPNIDCQGFCAFSTLDIDRDCNDDGNWENIFQGTIFYTLVKEHLSPCILECKLKDNSFAAKIENNKNIEAFINVTRSKNNVEIVGADMATVHFFDVATAAYSGGFVKVFPVYGAFKYIIHYMTDGEMDFASDYFFGNLISGDGRFMTITTGEQIRLGSGGNPTKVPFISFQKLFEEVNKKVNISFTIETNPFSGRKQIRIEPTSYFYNTGTSVTLNNVYGITKSVNTAELYSRLQIGSSETLPFDAGPPPLNFPTDIAFVGFKEESYTMTGKCNIDNTLNLVSDWIIDSNVIQDVFTNNNDGYDENIFFIMADYITDPLNQVAIQYDVFDTGGAPLFYNGFLRNSETALRWLGGIPNSIALYLGNGNDEFRASVNLQVSQTLPVSPVPVYIDPVRFEDDFTPPNQDPNGNYNNITFKYTVPATGFFTFKSDVNWFEGIGLTPSVLSLFRLVMRINGSVTEDIEVSFAFSISSCHAIVSASRYLQGGDTVNIAFKKTPQNSFPVQFTPLIGSYFECTNTSTGGGIFETYNPEDFKAYQYDFEYPITFSEYLAIVENPLKQMVINDGTNEITAWIDNMKYHHKEGKASFVLVNSLPKTACE